MTAAIGIIFDTPEKHIGRPKALPPRRCSPEKRISLTQAAQTKNRDPMNERRTTMKLLNKIFALLFCVIIITVQIPALAENNDAHVFFATFDISLRHNIIKSKYAVTVYLDGVKVDRMEQGDILTFGAYMSDGTTHELRFVADKKGVPDRVWTLGSLVPGSVLTCKLTAKHNQVKITSHTLSVNNQTIVSVSPDIEKAVKIAGTIIVYVVKAAGAAK